MMMAIKKYCCLVSKFVVSVWDVLDESEISRPEILFQSAPVPYICVIMLMVIFMTSSEAWLYGVYFVSILFNQTYCV